MKCPECKERRMSIDCDNEKYTCNCGSEIKWGGEKEKDEFAY